MKVIFDMVIKCEVDFKNDKIDERIKEDEFINDLKVDLIKDFKNWYGVSVTELDVSMSKSEQN